MNQSDLPTTTTLGVLISAAVMFGSLHPAQVVGDHAVAHDETGVAKLSVDLHHHSDKANQQVGDQFSTDGRSLKLHRKHKARLQHVFTGSKA